MVIRRPKRDHIFISYRRDDARGASGRLYDWLRIGFGPDRVFRDVNSIGAGNWRDKIGTALKRSAVCVAVIGPRWANAKNRRRLGDSSDMVRHELFIALASDGLTVVPTLVEGAQIPEAKTLPRRLRPLLDQEFQSVTEKGWEDDTRRLIAYIKEATKLSVGPDVDTLFRDVGASQRRVAELEHERDLQSSQIEALVGTVAKLTNKLAEAPSDQRPGLAAAFADLAHGETLTAEHTFERDFEAQSHAAKEARRGADKARRAAAEAARNVANLALLRDVTEAAKYYRKALEQEPGDAETARLLGDALTLLGDLQGAHAAYSQSLQSAIAQGDSQGEGWAQNGLGDLLFKRGTWTWPTGRTQKHFILLSVV